MLVLKRFLVVGILLSLSGCIHSSDEGLIESSKDDAKIVDSNLNYEEAYQIVSTHFKDCGRGAINLNEIAVTSNLDTQKQVGRISQTIHNFISGTNHLAVIDIKPAGTGSKTYIYTNGNPMNPDMDKWVRKWLNGESGC